MSTDRGQETVSSAMIPPRPPGPPAPPPPASGARGLPDVDLMLAHHILVRAGADLTAAQERVDYAIGIVSSMIRTRKTDVEEESETRR